MKWTALAVLLGLASCQSSAPAYAAECSLTYDTAISMADAASVSDPSLHIVIFDGEQAKRINDWVNAQPPVTDVRVDKFIVVIHKETPASGLGSRSFATAVFSRHRKCRRRSTTAAWKKFLEGRRDE